MADMIDEESLVRRRSRRSTAGNRMEAALAEMAALHPEQEIDADDDKDFLGPADEDEVFDSDFQSTDEEPDQDEEAPGEKQIIAEEKQTRKTVRQRLVRAAEARTSASGSVVKGSASAGVAVKVKRKTRHGMGRVSVGGATDAETGEAVSHRKSRRQSTMLSSQILNSRLRDAEERRAMIPKRAKELSVTYTQAELLARALDTEEGNIVSHRNYLEDEEEKRKRARVVKQKLTGPVLSWVSRVENEAVPANSSAVVVPSPPYQYNSKSDLSTREASTSANADGFATYQPYGAAPLPMSYFTPSAALQALSQSQTEAPSTEFEKVNKNYLLHKVDEEVTIPDWNETMTAIFGSHVNWEEVKVYSGKHRPLSRPVPKCPITGRTGIYRDPRSGVPFADVDAFRVLTRLLTHEYVWNDELRCYTADEKAVQLEPEPDETVASVPALSTG